MINRFFVFLVPAVLGLTVMVGCSRNSADVVARVNGKKITRGDLEKHYCKVAGSPSPQGTTEEQSSVVRLNILHELIDNEILMQRAEKLGLIATDDEVNDKYNEIKNDSPADFLKVLKDCGIAEADVKRDIRINLTADKVFNREVNSKINISDSDISSFYNTHRAELNRIEPQYHLAQILVTAQPDPQMPADKASNPVEAEKKAQMLYNRLRSGEDFDMLARRYSEDPETKNNGGDLGFAPESSLRSTDPATREAVLKLKDGQFSAPVPVVNPDTKQIFGYRIVKVIAKEPAGQRELSDPRVQQAIREQLRGTREQLLKAAYYEVVRNDAKVENYFAQQVLKTTTEQK